MFFLCTGHMHSQSINQSIHFVHSRARHGGFGTEATSHRVVHRPSGQQLLLSGVDFQFPLHVDPGAFFGTREVLSQRASG